MSFFTIFPAENHWILGKEISAFRPILLLPDFFFSFFFFGAALTPVTLCHVPQNLDVSTTTHVDPPNNKPQCAPTSSTPSIQTRIHAGSRSPWESFGGKRQNLCSFGDCFFSSPAMGVGVEVPVVAVVVAAEGKMRKACEAEKRGRLARVAPHGPVWSEAAPRLPLVPLHLPLAREVRLSFSALHFPSSIAQPPTAAPLSPDASSRFPASVPSSLLSLSLPLSSSAFLPPSPRAPHLFAWTLIASLAILHAKQQPSPAPLPLSRMLSSHEHVLFPRVSASRRLG
ncbi:hypothetical protein KC325_g65 [Hortaea werneckii]|nr:hypothetical protein KC325_g65 [Hortaea werneckii]